MTKKEMWQICAANGINPLLYKWSFSEDLEDSSFKKMLMPVFEDIDSFIRGRNVWYIFLEDSVLGSRVGSTFFKSAILSGFSKVRYTTIENIAGYRLENWYEDGDVYFNILDADLLVIDKIKNTMEDFQKKVWDAFVEERLLANKSTIFVGLVRPTKQGLFDNRAVDIFKSIGVKILTDTGLEDAVQ